MNTSRRSHAQMNGTIYIMKLVDDSGLRVGVYSTTRKSRETQVRGGLGVDVKINWETPLKSKAHALAVESLAHLFLAEFENWRKVGKKTIQIFDCEMEVAQAACQKAIKLTETGI